MIPWQKLALSVFAVVWILLLLSVITTTNDGAADEVKPIELSSNNLRVAAGEYRKMDSLGGTYSRTISTLSHLFTH